MTSSRIFADPAPPQVRGAATFGREKRLGSFTPSSLIIAIRLRNRLTADSRRPTSSPAPNANVTSPHTNTTPPSGPSDKPASGPIGAVGVGRQQRKGRLTHPTHPATPVISV